MPTQTPTSPPTPIQTTNPTSVSTPSPSPTPAPTPIKVSVSTALTSGYVQAVFSGTGGSSGDCITLTLRRLVAFPVEIEVPATGTVLAGSANAQNMVLLSLTGIKRGTGTYTPANNIVLSDTNETAYIFRAFCLELHKNNPQTTDQFIISQNTNADVTKILNTVPSLLSVVTSNSAIQTAIWVVTDNVSLAELKSIFFSGVSQVENAKTILTAAGIDVSNKQLFA
jgi:hypothetical protein